MKIFNVFFVTILLVLVSCSNPEPKEVQVFNEKMDKTIAIHDEVMPEMSKISRLMTNLETKMDSTNVETIKPAIEDLKIAHDKMMTWMANFGEEFSRTEINEGIQLKNADSLKLRLKALDKSMEEAKDMRDHVNEAISNAEALVD